jgi:hypothetical protein
MPSVVKKITNFIFSVPNVKIKKKFTINFIINNSSSESFINKINYSIFYFKENIKILN